jgi:4'-phosphopantetheinyl transferase EntD
VSVEEEVLLRFSIKESLYKAMHPLICQYVGFQEAAVQPLVGGGVAASLNLRSGAHERFGEVTAHWRRLNGYFLSTASVSLSGAEEGTGNQ